VTPPELARRWGIDVHKVLQWIRAGELRAIDASTVRGGRPRYLIDQVDVAVFEASRTVQPPAARLPRRRKDPAVIQFF
jgi:transposase